MNLLDTIIRGGRISTAADTFFCDICITNGQITALGKDLGSEKQVIDAQGKWAAADWSCATAKPF